MSEPAEQPPPPPAPPAPKRDMVGDFKAMLPAEKMLAIAALAVLLAFLFKRSWGGLFAGWFDTCAFLGAVCVLVLTGLDLFGVKFLSGKARTYVMILLGVLPAAGFVIDTLSHDFWVAVMLAGAIVMGFAAVKITSRENIIKR
ncbi:MAG: hypothetical protein ACYTDU_07950 [Planctomycetota bacterium]